MGTFPGSFPDNAAAHAARAARPRRASRRVPADGAEAPVRPVADLAVPLVCTPASVYQAVRRGWIGGIVRVGAAIKIKNPAFAFHSENGFGPGQPVWTPEVGGKAA